MNFYSTLDVLKGYLPDSFSDTSNDAALMRTLDSSSREIDRLAKRVFYSASATRFFDTAAAGYLLIDDCLAVSALTTDSEGDGSFDGETWSEGAANDFFLVPLNSWPKLTVNVAVNGSYSFAKDRENYVQIVGTWGYGDGLSNDPWDVTGVTVTVGDASLTAVTATGTTIKAGHTIKAGSEQMFVSAVSGDTALTVVRGVNGTTAAAQATAAVSVAKYPADIVNAVLAFAAEAWSARSHAGVKSEGIGAYRVEFSLESDSVRRRENMVSNFVKAIIA